MGKPMFRYEQKYRINRYQYEELRQVVSRIMQKDKHVGEERDYMIRSLYFDDMYESAYKEKLDGVYSRKKYRIRIYNYGDRIIHLECKHKAGAYIFKESVPITRAEYENILAGDGSFLLKKDAPIAREFFVDTRTKLLAPKVIVDYDREPFIYDAGTVRVTFDKEIRAADPKECIFDPYAPTYAVYPPDDLILEIKFTGFIPEKIRRIFKVRNFTQVSASKYCLCVDRMRDILQV